MTAPAWGPPVGGVRFGLVGPGHPVEAGGHIPMTVHVENNGASPIFVYGFNPQFERSLNVSGPTSTRPHMRVSFGLPGVAHPPEAFAWLVPGTGMSAPLDLSAAFDQRPKGTWPVAFGYDPVAATSDIEPWLPSTEAASGTVPVVIHRARSLVDAGLDPDTENGLHAQLAANSEVAFADTLKRHGAGVAIFAARKLSRVLAPGPEAIPGWRALDALCSWDDRTGLDAIAQVRAELPHATAALDLAADFIAHRAGGAPPGDHLPFTSLLERCMHDPSARGNLVVCWEPYDSAVLGRKVIVIRGHGGAMVTSRRPNEARPSTVQKTLTEPQMRELLHTMGAAAIWLLRPLRDRGLPEEPRPTLEVQLGLGMPFRRTVTLWDGEWRHGPARDLAELLDRLAS